MRLARTSLLPCSVAELAPQLARSPLLNHDSGHSGPVEVWDHRIRLDDFHKMTRYTDEVEVRAGPPTLPAAAFAYAFYTHRQRRLNRLVAAGFAS